jgi:hypothetical protein
MKTEGVCSDGLIGPKGNCKQPSTYQSDETKCDGKDNDCDGTVDENCPCAYDGQNTGVCGTAKIDPSSGMCAEPADYEQTESTCDSKDNDCDGDIDDADSDLTCSCNAGDTQMCYTGPSGTAGTGICQQGSQRCRMDGSWTMCAGQKKPKSEGGGNNCDGKDNDCDGVVDEGCTCNYDMKTEGVCVNQTRDSNGDCPVPNDFQSSEATCSDNLDNDCDGTIDCADSDCSGQSCGSGSGATCQNQGCVETSCTDGVDNDQDGRTDCLDSDCSVCGSGSTCGADGACKETNCENGTDDDGDGMPDCADPDCDNELCGSSVLGDQYCCQGNSMCSRNCAP